MLEVSEAEAWQCWRHRRREWDAGAVTRVMEVLSECEMRLRDARRRRKILIEVALLKAMEARRALSLDRCFATVLQSLRNGDTTGAMLLAPAKAPPLPSPAPKNAAKRSGERERDEPTCARGDEGELRTARARMAAATTDLRGLWGQLVESVPDEPARSCGRICWRRTSSVVQEFGRLRSASTPSLRSTSAWWTTFRRVLNHYFCCKRSLPNSGPCARANKVYKIGTTGRLGGAAG